MCSDASVFADCFGVSKSNNKVAIRDAKRVLEAYGRALCKIQCDLHRDVDIVLTCYDRGGCDFREYRFAVFERGTNKFIYNYTLRL